MICFLSLQIIRDQEDQQIPVLFLFTIRQTDSFCEKRKKNGMKITFFGEVPDLKYSRSLKNVTNLHNRSKQSHFPAQIHQVSHCLLSIIGQLSIIHRSSIDKDRTTHSFRLTEHVAITTL